MNKFLSWLDRFHWLWLALAAPLLLFPTPKRSLAMLVVPCLWLLGWIVNCAHQVEERASASMPITPLNGTILLMALMVLVSTWATYDIKVSLPKISGMVLGLGVYFAIARGGSTPRGWWMSLLLFLAMGLAVAGLGLLGTNWFGSKISLLNPITTRIPFLIQGLQGAEGGFHPNEVAGALAWVLPLLLALSVGLAFPNRIIPIMSLRGGPAGRRSNLESSKVILLHPLLWARNDIKSGWIWLLRFSLWPATLFVGGVFVLAQSRGGYIAMAIAMLLMLLLALPKAWRWVLLALVLILGVVLGLILSQGDSMQVKDWIVGSGVTTDAALSLNTLEGRLEIWSRAIYGLQDFPFTGMGMNTFREVVHVLYPLFLIAPDRDFGHAHNEFLQAGLDLGIPGMIAFMGLYMGAFWMLGRSWLRKVQPKMLVLGLGGGLLAHMLYGLTDAVALGAKPGVLFWMLLGLIAGLHELDVEDLDKNST